jgi:deoxyribose-phosphate aldolase
MAVKTKDILAMVDHTLLAQTATWEQIRALCDDGMRYATASVCIPPCYVQQAKDYVGDRLAICTVIGFPNGYSTTAAKCFEAREAVENGADEIDMVINVGRLKDGLTDAVRDEIAAVKAACADKLLKVIIETCLLTEEEKVTMCRLVSVAGADYIKTSAGFSAGGATREDVALMRAHVAPQVRVKAAGGIASMQDAADFAALGADRLGTSRIVKLVKEITEKGSEQDGELSDPAY